MLGLSRRALYRRLERLDLGRYNHAPSRAGAGGEGVSAVRVRECALPPQRVRGPVCGHGPFSALSTVAPWRDDSRGASP